MSTVVKNTGVMERTTTGGGNTNPVKSYGEVGTVRVQYQGIEYVFGPNDHKTLEDGIAAALVAADSRLSVLNTSMASWPVSNASVLTHIT